MNGDNLVYFEVMCSSIHENSYEEIDHEDPNYQRYISQLKGVGLW